MGIFWGRGKGLQMAATEIPKPFTLVPSTFHHSVSLPQLQLKSLQSKMHGALTEFFKLNGLYNEGELTRLEQVSSENGLRVGQLQMDMEEALGLITHFLQTEMDGTRAREMAWEAVKKMEEQKKNGTALRPDSSMVLAS